MRDLKHGRDGSTEGWRPGRHLNTCRGGQHDKHVLLCANICTRGGLEVCVCVGGSVGIPASAEWAQRVNMPVGVGLVTSVNQSVAGRG